MAWLFGSWLLLGTTCFYLVGVYLLEEDFMLSDEVWRPLPGSLSAASLQQHEHEEQQQQRQQQALTPLAGAPRASVAGVVGGGGGSKEAGQQQTREPGGVKKASPEGIHMA